jgi:hypothetical protein
LVHHDVAESSLRAADEQIAAVAVCFEIARGGLVGGLAVATQNEHRLDDIARRITTVTAESRPQFFW